MAEYDNLPTIIWEVWKHHNSARTSDIFQNFLHEAIAQGEEYILMLIDIFPMQVGRDVDLKPWGMKLLELLSKVHRAIAALKIRLEMVQLGMAKRRPNILCP